jgi:hypothetical protein
MALSPWHLENRQQQDRVKRKTRKDTAIVVPHCLADSKYSTID